MGSKPPCPLTAGARRGDKNRFLAVVLLKMRAPSATNPPNPPFLTPFARQNCYSPTGFQLEFGS